MLRGRGITQLLVCGVTTEVCVNTTVREANDRASIAWCWRTAPAPTFPNSRRRHRHDQGAGRHLRLVRAVRGAARRTRMNEGTSDERTYAGAILWVAGDWNGFFGLFTNVALNVIVADRPVSWRGEAAGGHRVRPRAPCTRHRPADRQPVLCWLAWQLARREGRSDVTALPYGPSVPHMFIVVFLSCCRPT